MVELDALSALVEEYEQEHFLGLEAARFPV